MDSKNYIISDCNACAYHEIMSVLQDSKCVLLSGLSSVGKSHLIKTVEDAYRKCFPDRKVKLEAFEDIINRFLKLTKDEKTDEFYDELISNDLILIEDMKIKGKTSTQQEVAFWMSKVITAEKNIIISTADKPRHLSVLTDSASKLCGERFVHAEMDEPDIKFREKLLDKLEADVGVCIPLMVKKYMIHSTEIPVGSFSNCINRIQLLKKQNENLSESEMIDSIQRY